MPRREEHLQQAKRNEKLAGTLQAEYRDWCVTTLYYAGLHYIEMQLAVEGSHPPTHEERDPTISKHHLLRKIWSPYKKLKVLSRNARYEAYVVTDDDINSAKKWVGEIKDFLVGIGHKFD